MIGQTLGHYHILERVAAGGFGVVYRARDVQLERDVAVKVLPSGTFSNDSSRRNFRKEALALAKFNHPNIETVYEFGSQEGVDYLVLEYLPGKTLLDKLTTGPLSEKELISFAIQVVEALEEAHESGIVHQDLKPANIVITAKGQVKVLDFGLAKWLRPEEELTADQLTDPLAGAGTLPYMSPEQLSGERVDARADIYSIGAVLYEMATSRKAFSGTLASQVIAAILHQPPVSPRAFNSKISQPLEEIILKCLDKDPTQRYQSAKELLVDLRRTSARSVVHVRKPATRWPRWRRVLFSSFLVIAALSGFMAVGVGLNLGGLRDRFVRHTQTPQIESLAVLPLENRSQDPDQDYFADGITDELITELAKISALKVISHTSIMRFKGTNKLLPEIASTLHVDALVEGSVQRSGHRVRINARLIRAVDDHEQEVWARSYERDMSDILTLQNEVARAIANEVRIRLTPNEHARLVEARSVNPEAHEAYLAGRYYWNKGTAEGLQKSINLLEQAIAKDPHNALAYAALADSYHSLPELTNVSVTEAFPRARTAALKALEIDESLGEAHSALANIKEDYDWDWAGAEVEYKRAIELTPGDATAHASYSNLLLELGRFPEALAEAATAQSLDPLSIFANENLAAMLYYAGESDRAIWQCRKTLDLDPLSFQTHRHLAEIYTQRHLYPEAVSELKKALDISSGNLEVLAELGYVLGISGKSDQAKQTLLQLKSDNNVSPYRLAIVFMGLGERENALESLTEAVKRRSPGVVHLKITPFFTELRSDQRFKALLLYMGLGIQE